MNEHDFQKVMGDLQKRPRKDKVDPLSEKFKAINNEQNRKGLIINERV